MARKMDSISLQKIGKFDTRKEVVIGIPKKNKSGYLISGVLLDECTLTRKSQERGGLITTANPNYKVLELPSSDIPLYVKGGVCDVGICGTDMVLESGMAKYAEAGGTEGRRSGAWESLVAEATSFLDRLVEIGKEVRLCLVAGAEREMPLGWLDCGRFGTTFPNTSKAFLAYSGVSAEILILGGSVEQAWLEGLIDAGTDQVETGNSLRKAGMRDLATLAYSKYCLWANKEAYGAKKALVDRLAMMMDGVLCARRDYILSGGDNGKLKESGKKLVKFNVPPKRKKAIGEAINDGRIPSGESPTRAPLTKGGWYAYEIVVEAKALLDALAELKRCGARDVIWTDLSGYVK